MRRTKADAEQTRNAILDAAERLFYERGVSATALEQIAKAASVTRGAVYWHFKDKNALLEALRAKFRPPQAEVVKLALDEGHPDILALLEVTGKLVLEEFEAEESRQRLFVILTSRSSIDLDSDSDQQDAKMVLRLTTAAYEAGQLAEDLTPEAAALSLTVVMRGVLTHWLLSGRSFSLSQDGNAMMCRHLRSLRRKQD